LRRLWERVTIAFTSHACDRHGLGERLTLYPQRFATLTPAASLMVLRIGGGASRHFVVVRTDPKYAGPQVPS
jgi:hypothetical protein